MAYQTTRLNADRDDGPVRSVTRDASSLVGDALDLAELQVQLLRCDTRNALAKGKPALVGMVSAVGLLLAALPVLGQGIASSIAWAADWPLWPAQILVGAVFAIIGCFIAWFSVKTMKSALTAFSTSQKEVAANIRWLRQSISNAASGD